MRPAFSAGDDMVFRPLEAGEAESIVQAVLRASEDGLLLTDLDHRSLACNRRFGELFGVAHHDVVRANPEELRRQVLPNLADPEGWLASLEEVYAEPSRVLQDELVLTHPQRTVLRRYTAPTVGPDGRIFGRLWTFRDITVERRVRDIQQLLSEMTSLHDPDPDVVCRRIMQALSQSFDNSTALLSIRRGDELEFKSVVGPPSILHRIPGNAMRDSYCQFAIRDVRPLLVQDARQLPQFADTKPARAGYTRYLGAPILDEAGEPIGTICILDTRPHLALRDADVQLMSLVAMRISSELIRDLHIRTRLAEKDAELRRQQEHLQATESVLVAMNSAFALLTADISADELLRAQSERLTGLLGYGRAAVLVRSPGAKKHRGFANGRPLECVFDERAGSGTCGDHALVRRLRKPWLSYLQRQDEEVGDILVAFAREEEPPSDERHRIHLEALADQVCLLLSTQLLHQQLVRANAELGEAHDELLRSEKLSIAGTLAASTAHDIRNITASMALLADPATGDPLTALGRIREQLARFNVLAHRLLSYVRPQAVLRRQVDLAQIMEGVLALTSAQLRVGKVAVEIKIPKSLPNVSADANQLEHLFINLILNAVQAMDLKGGGKLSIVVDAPREWVRIRFVDDGPGIPEEALETLFEPFVTTRANGFGLGLFSCRRIAEAHGGSIEASRNPGLGSTFTLRLPVERIKEREATWKPSS